MKRTTRIGSADLQRTRRKLEYWRRTHEPPARIPEDLWARAVEIAGEKGVYATSHALRLNYGSLKKRVEATSSKGKGEGKAAFLEIPPLSSIVGPECLIELEDGKGSMMRIQIKGTQASDLAALARNLWRGGP